MSYVKATAEVVMLDMQDVVRTSYSYTDVKNLFNSLHDGPKELLSSVLLNPDDIKGLQNLLNDVSEEEADRLIRLLANSNESAEYLGTLRATYDSVRLTATCNDASHNDIYRYSAEEEADSFDSEW